MLSRTYRQSGEPRRGLLGLGSSGLSSASALGGVACVLPDTRSRSNYESVGPVVMFGIKSAEAIPGWFGIGTTKAIASSSSTIPVALTLAQTMGVDMSAYIPNPISREVVKS